LNIGLTAAISLNACRVNIWRILNIRGLFHQRQHSMRKRIRSSERVFGETSAFKRACFHGFRTLNVLAQLSALATKGAFARHTSACTQHGRLHGLCGIDGGHRQPVVWGSASLRMRRHGRDVTRFRGFYGRATRRLCVVGDHVSIVPTLAPFGTKTSRQHTAQSMKISVRRVKLTLKLHYNEWFYLFSGTISLQSASTS